ncbi:hypothetical protein [Nostoc sp.]
MKYSRYNYGETNLWLWAIAICFQNAKLQTSKYDPFARQSFLE